MILLSLEVLIFLLALPVAIASFVFMWILRKVPEASAWIKAWLSGGTVVHSFDDQGLMHLYVAKPVGKEGQLVTGKVRKLGKRLVFQLPRINNRFVAHRFFSSGIRSPVFLHYMGKTVAVNPGVAAAIEVAETPKENIPPGVAEWAKEHHVTLQFKQSDSKTVTVPLFSLDPRKLRVYFWRHYDESAYAVLLDQHYQWGFQDGLATAKGRDVKVIVLGAAVLIVVALVVLLVLKGQGII